MHKKIGICLLILLCTTFFSSESHAQIKTFKDGGYLFVYFTGNSGTEESIRFALSKDGYHFKALNHNQPILDSKEISSTGGVRDPHILRGKDGKTFYMVVTDMTAAKGWNSNRAMILLKSNDLINWTSSVVNIQKKYAGQDSLLRVWAPQTIYDPKAKKYMIYFSMKHGSGPDIIYYAYANKDFTDLEGEPKQLFFSPSNMSCIDADIIYDNGLYRLFFKTEDAAQKGIKIATSKNLTSGYVLNDSYVQQTKDPVEGSSVFPLKDGSGYIFMYDCYSTHKYQFTFSKDLTNFKVVDEDVSMDFHPRHGTVLPISDREMKRLIAKWGDSSFYAVNNPVLKGYYADPDIIYSHKTDSFYIYPTTDGFTNWGGYYFKTFASKDLVHWHDDGRILTLGKDVQWTDHNAWAPTMAEKKTADGYKYYFYFTAGQKIGVAVSDNPNGPFKDSGKPLIDKFPDGIKGGQQIDPVVFHDPVSGKYFLYWGNGYMAVAELNEDMLSLKDGTTQVITPDKSFREGSYVFYRNGKYYILWSVDDTRSPNYHVRYGIADSPTGKLYIPENNIVIASNKENGIIGTGHNSIIQIPGKDEWYIVYHRLNYPNGKEMGEAAGYNREVCIDKLTFRPDGTIVPVIPTIQGIKPIKLP